MARPPCCTVIFYSGPERTNQTLAPKRTFHAFSAPPVGEGEGVTTPPDATKTRALDTNIIKNMRTRYKKEMYDRMYNFCSAHTEWDQMSSPSYSRLRAGRLSWLLQGEVLQTRRGRPSWLQVWHSVWGLLQLLPRLRPALPENGWVRCPPAFVKPPGPVCPVLFDSVEGDHRTVGQTSAFHFKEVLNVFRKND